MKEMGNFSVEEYNDGHSTGLTVYKNGNIIAIFDEPIGDKVFNVYVYDDKDNEDFSHKIELKNY